jgi:hypothetical protein
VKSRLLAGVVAVLLAIAGAVIVVSSAQGADQRAVKGLDPVDVLVVAKRPRQVPRRKSSRRPWPFSNSPSP